MQPNPSHPLLHRITRGYIADGKYLINEYGRICMRSWHVWGCTDHLPLLSFFLWFSFFSRLLVSLSSQVTFNVSPPDPDPELVHVGKAGESSRRVWSRPDVENYKQKVEILSWKPCWVMFWSCTRLSSWFFVLSFVGEMFETKWMRKQWNPWYSLYFKQFVSFTQEKRTF